MAVPNMTHSSYKDVTIDQMDYGFIDKCSNEKELEHILRALRSGKEGYYPDLIDFCEKKLQSINPKNKALRKQQPILKAWDLGKDEMQNLTNDMEKWSEEMADKEQVQTGRASAEPQVNGYGDHNDLPPIRGSHILKGKKKKKVENGDAQLPNPNRIKSSDYKAWDKYDVDKECEKLDDDGGDATPPDTKKIALENEIDASGLTKEERETKALREKEKGNEAFKSGDFEEALSYYCRSISLQPIAASFNNRALVYLRLEKWKEAIADCNTVFSFEGEEGNLKAMLRRATGLKALGSYEEAKKDLHFVIEKEPNNARAKSILTSIEKLKAETKENAQLEETKSEDFTKTEEDATPQPKTGKKMVITEVEGDSEDSEEDNGNNLPPAGEDSKSDIKHEKEKPKTKAPEIKSENLSKKNSELKSEENKSEKEPASSYFPPKQVAAEENEKETTEISSKKPADSLPSAHPVASSSKENDESAKTTPNAAHPPPEEVMPSHVEPIYPTPVEALKKKAGYFFKSGQYAEACNFYTKALDRISALLKKENVDPGHKMASAVLYNNRAACWLKQGNDKACIDDCNEVLKMKTWDVKAFMRRAVAYEHLEKYVHAWVDFQSAHSMDWQNTLAQDGANRVAKHLREIHGSKWREMVPKVERYPYHSSSTLISQATKRSNPSLLETPNPPESGTEKDVPPPKSDSRPLTPKVDKKDEPSKENSQNKGAKPKSKPQAPSGKTKSRKRNKSKSKSRRKSEDEPTPEKEKDLEEKRMEITRSLFEKLKSEGNEHVKSGKYEDAIQCYTRCLGLCPKEPASYTNRALCFLRLKKHVSAVNDCTEAIKLDPINVKAYYRRALARKAEGFYKDAERDLKKLLDLNPENKAARNELDAIQKLAKRSNEKINNEQKVPRKKQVVIEEVDSSSSSDEAEFILPKEEPTEVAQKKQAEEKTSASTKEMDAARNKGPTSQNVSKKELEAEYAKSVADLKKLAESDVPKATDIGSNSKIENKTVQSEDKKTFDTQNAKSEKSSTADNVENKPNEASSVPSSETAATKSPQQEIRLTTPYEFGNVWNSITDKSDLTAYKSLFNRTVPKDLPELLSNKIDDHVISVVAKIATQCAKLEGDFQRGYDLLYHITEAKRFSMAVMFLSDSEKKPLLEAFKALSAQNAKKTFSDTDLAELRKKYLL